KTRSPFIQETVFAALAILETTGSPPDKLAASYPEASLMKDAVPLVAERATLPSKREVLCMESYGDADTLNFVPSTSITCRGVSTINFFLSFTTSKYPSPSKMTFRVSPSNLDGKEMLDKEFSQTLVPSGKVRLYCPPAFIATSIHSTGASLPSSIAVSCIAPESSIKSA